MALTPSQRALGKYLFLVVALFTTQVFLGGFTAHYTVEGQQFYGIDLSQWFPYALVRTWHLQSALFWIATGFLWASVALALWSAARYFVDGQRALSTMHRD